MALEERLKQRLLGGAVLVALIVIFVPMLIEEPVDQRVVSDHAIPIKPQPQRPAPAIDAPKKPVKPVVPQPPLPTPVVDEPPPPPKPKAIAKPKPKTTAPVAKPKPRPSPTAWIIQVASLTNQANAGKLVEKLRKADLPAQMERVKLGGKQHYRVRVGPEVDHRLAKKMLAKIKKDFKLTPKLMRYPQ